MAPINERDVETTETAHGATQFRRTHLSVAAADGDRDPKLGCSVYELPPDTRSWPYHYHAGNAEAMYVLEGTGRVRLDGEEHTLEPGDYVPFPPDEAGGHRVINDSDGLLRYLAMSTMEEPDVIVYPDSEKVGVYAGSPPGGREARHVEGYYRLDDDVDYWDGEGAIDDRDSEQGVDD